MQRLRHHLIPAAHLEAGLATIIVRLPGRTIRSRALIVEKLDRGLVNVAFASGDVLTFQPKAMVGRVDMPPKRRRAA